MRRKPSRIFGFGKINFTMEEVTGKYVRNYCVANNIKLGKFFEDLAVDHLIKEGKIESREALEREIKSMMMEIG